MNEIKTHGLFVDFGKHKGEPWTGVPISYLHWLMWSKDGPKGSPEIARAELKRRGNLPPAIEISGHAIDSASLSCRKAWHETALDKSEGLYAWLCRIAMTSLDAHPHRENEGPEISRGFWGMTLVFVFDEGYPTLKTIMPTHVKAAPKLKAQRSLPL